MKRCPQCRRDYYDETLLYCLDDGTALLEGPSSGSDRKTEVIESPDSQRTGVLTEGETKIYRERPSGGKRLVIVAGIVLGALAIIGGAYGVYRATLDDGAPRTINVQTQRLSGDGRTRYPVISPDGKFLAYVKLEDNKRSLWIKQVATGSTVNVVKPGESSQFDWITFSPDGNFVYFNARMSSNDPPTVYRVAALGGTPMKFISNAAFLQFSRDGKHISFRRVDPTEISESIIVADADGNDQKNVAKRSKGRYFQTAASWSADGKQLAVGAGDDALGPTNSTFVQLISVETGETKELGERRWDNVSALTWHPSGDSLIVIASDSVYPNDQLWELGYPSGKYRRLTNNLNGHYAVSITADGRSIVTGEISSRSAIYVSPDLEPANAKPVMPAMSDTWGLAWTADGRIAYISDQTGDAELWIMNADGGDARQLTNDRIFKWNPSASADGRYIVYTSLQNGGQLVRIDTSGANSRVVTKVMGADNGNFSPDGRWIIYDGFVEGLPRILRTPVDGGEEQVIGDRPAKEPRYSNDGTRFACFTMNETTIQWSKLLIYSADGGSAMTVIDIPAETTVSRGPVWTPDDKGVVLINASGERQDLWYQPVDGSPGRLITNLPPPGFARRDYSRDGKRIAVVRADGIGNAIMITDFR